jgi:hypothetical protein
MSLTMSEPTFSKSELPPSEIIEDEAAYDDEEEFEDEGEYEDVDDEEDVDDDDEEEWEDSEVHISNISLFRSSSHPYHNPSLLS